MELSLQPRLELTLKQELKLKLKQRLEQQLKLEMTLGQYLFYEDIIHELIKWTDQHDAWQKYDKNGFKFTYAAVPYKIAEPIASVAGPGFAHCFFNPFEGRARGDWNLFVVPDMLSDPNQDFVETIALHERGEEISLGDHYFSSQLEFADIIQQNKIRRYTSFIDTEYPCKFVDLTQRVLFPILPKELIEDLNLQGKRNEMELGRAEELIDKYPLPMTVLRYVDKYGKVTDDIVEKIRKATGPTQKKIHDSHFNGPNDAEAAADIVDEELVKLFTSISPIEARIISNKHTAEAMINYNNLVNQSVLRGTDRHLNIPIYFQKAYQDANQGKRLVTVRYIPEDLARQQKQEIEGYAQIA